MSPALDIFLSPGGNIHAPGLKKRVDGFGTRAIHVGSEPNPETGAVIPPISLSTTYKQNAIGVHKVRILALTIISFTDRRFRVLNTHAQETQTETPLKLPWRPLKLVEHMPWLLHLDRRRPQLCCSHSAEMHISFVSTMSTVGPFGTCAGSLLRTKALRLRLWISRMLLTTNSSHQFGIIPRYL